MFSLVKQAFDPCEAIELVQSVFNMQASANGVRIVFEVYNYLQPPHALPVCENQRQHSLVPFIPKVVGDVLRF